MILEIEWDGGSKKVTVPPCESDVYKAIGKILLDITIPNTIYVKCSNGNAVFSINKRGTFIKNGIKRPSMYVTEKSNTITGLKQSIYEEAYLTCINPESNNYKFYHLKPSSFGINVSYGRIGTNRGDMFGVKDIQTPYPTHMYWIRYYEKLSKGYIDQSNIYLNNESCNSFIEKTAEAKSINTLSQQLYDELRSCARQYIVTQCVSISVTQEQYRVSKRYLSELAQTNDLNTFNQKLMELISVCPRKTRYVNELLAKSKTDFLDIINREENLVNAMQALLSGSSDVDIQNSFENMGIYIFEATDKQKKEVLRHLDDSLEGKIDTIYRVINSKQKVSFNEYLKRNRIKKVKEFWHGSKNENWFSIIVNGLQLNPNAKITGKMFGKGIYFAPSSKKSWNYTSYRGTYWANGSSDTAYMGLYATAYGVPEDVYCAGDYTQDYLLKIHRNCIHAHAGRQLRNDEIIFYDEAAVCLNYIVKFK